MGEIKKMKILLISAANNIHTIRWANALNRYGYNIEIISLKNHYNNTNNLIDKGIQVTYLPITGKKGYYLNAFYLNKLIEKKSPDIINVHYASGYGTLGRFIKFEKKILNVWGSDIYIYPQKNIINKRILIKNLKSYNYISSTSECMAKETKKYIKNEKKIYITPFGVDLNIFKKIEKEKRKKEKIVIGLIKSLEKIYGISNLIKGFDELVKKLKKEKKFLQIELQIYGKGSLEKELKEEVKKMGLKNVFFKGYIKNDEVPKILSEIDLVCIPSLSESFGVAAIEAMACEVPLIVSDAHGLQEVVSDKLKNIVFKKDNYIEMAEKMYELLNNSELSKKNIKIAKEIVLKKYSWEKNVKNMIDIYEDIYTKRENNV